MKKKLTEYNHFLNLLKKYLFLIFFLIGAGLMIIVPDDSVFAASKQDQKVQSPQTPKTQKNNTKKPKNTYTFNPNSQKPFAACNDAVSKGKLYKDVLDYLLPWTQNPENTSPDLAKCITLTTNCYRLLNRTDEIDAYLENLCKIHANQWQVLQEVAGIYFVNNNGVIQDGVFHRGGGGNGIYVSSMQRDHVRAIQLMLQALPLVEKELKNSKNDVIIQDRTFEFYHTFANFIYREVSWKLQTLTDYKTLPDYEENDRYNYGTSFAPVNKNGNPIYYNIPRSFESAQNNGERYRWLQEQGVKINPSKYRNQYLMERASFLQKQFGVNTLHEYRFFFQNDQRTSTDLQKEEGIWNLHTLSDEECMAKLATGLKRFTPPSDQNYILLYKEVFRSNNQNDRLQAGQKLAEEYLHRQQYVKSTEILRELIKGDYAPSIIKSLQEQLNRIEGNLGQFEPFPGAAADTPVKIGWKYRNGNSVTFKAYLIDIPTFTNDIIKAIKEAENTPVNLSEIIQKKYGTDRVESIGYCLIQRPDLREKYLKAKTAEWVVDLNPAKDHFQKITSIELPFSKPGAYLLEAKMKDGNKDTLVVWIQDTAIITRSLENENYFAIVDAKTGQPLDKMRLEFFGYKMTKMEEVSEDSGSRIKKNKPIKSIWKYREFTKEAKNGEVNLKKDDALELSKMNWIVMAKGMDNSNRFALLGARTYWFSTKEDQNYSTTKAYFITDRPVYRPEQEVHYKIWVGYTQYDMPNTIEWAGKKVHIRLNNPKGEVVLEKDCILDEFGGLNDSFKLEKGMPLGEWSISLQQEKNGNWLGSIQFRVEEYKKPEYEVTVDAPKDPIRLGEKFKVEISAKYYFGAPVTNAKVKYKVTRTTHNINWYPVRPWDWFYGNGYWWFAPDYSWYPGWRNWGCPAPVIKFVNRPYYNYRPNVPEVIAEEEVDIGSDGKVQVEVDSSVAKTIYPNDDQNYTITAEVIDQSRRTIVGEGSVKVAKDAFKVYTWLHRGFYQPKDQMKVSIQTRRIDEKPVPGQAVVKIYRISYKKAENKVDLQPVEKEIHTTSTIIDKEGKADITLSAGDPGTYRISSIVTDDQGHCQEGGHLFTIHDSGTVTDTKNDFRFNQLELITEKAEYVPNEKLRLLVNTNQKNSTVFLFLRSEGNTVHRPTLLRLNGQTKIFELPIEQKDVPNFFIEAITVANGEIYTARREIIVPPASRILNVDVHPSKEKYRPGEKARAELEVTDLQGKPVVGQIVVSVYDKSVEYVSGGSNINNIKEFFWKWRRNSWLHYMSNLNERSTNHIIPNEEEMFFTPLGMFDNLMFGQAHDKNSAVDEFQFGIAGTMGSMSGGGMGGDMGSRSLEQTFARNNDQMVMYSKRKGVPASAAAPMSLMAEDQMDAAAKPESMEFSLRKERGKRTETMVEAQVRSNFTDTAYWNAVLQTNKQGKASIELDMPDNLTTWKIKVWTLTSGTRVGQGETEVITSKDLIIRMQRPRFLVQKDEAVLTANIHNYLDSKKEVEVSLELPKSNENSSLILRDNKTAVRKIEIPSQGEARVDWKVRAEAVGEVVLRMKALTDEESDAVEEKINVLVHGIEKQEAVSGMIEARKDTDKPAIASFTMTVPKERREEESRLTVRFSPTLAGAMLDAIPYLVAYPYGCTEQTLNRFLPTVLTQNVLRKSGINLTGLAEKQVNLNAQELGDSQKRSEQWKQKGRKQEELNPVFDEKKVRDMIRAGVERLQQMQCEDGGWGWFSGYGEHSTPHLTAQVVHGLLLAKMAEAEIDDNIIERGKQWLIEYQKKAAILIYRGETWTDEEKAKRKQPWNSSVDNMDAFVYLVLTEAGLRSSNDNVVLPKNEKDFVKKINNVGYCLSFMKERLWTQRANVSYYANSLYALALCNEGIDGNRKRIEDMTHLLAQHVKMDDENQSAWLDLSGSGSCWWYWYGDNIETQANYLKLLVRLNPKDSTAPRLVKYLLNNRKNATYWNSTRDTAACLEAFCEYLKTTNEMTVNTTVEVLVNDKVEKKVEITPNNLFSIDNTLEIVGKKVKTGPQKITIRHSGSGPLYYNGYLSNFTMEDPIVKAGLEVKVERRYYLLEENKEAREEVEGGHGQVISQRVSKFKKTPLTSLAEVKSGALVEVELLITSKNDYESILIEDYKAAGFEPVELRSGYNGNSMGAYVEYRDEKVCFFVYQLQKGKHSMTYRLRAEQPGKYSAMPTRIWGMYAPELKGNADEYKFQIND